MPKLRDTLYFPVLTAVGVAIALFLSVCGGNAYAEGYTTGDARAAIHAAAVEYGVSEETMLRTAWCESELKPGARGDWRRGIGPTAFGMWQISNLPGTGLLNFYHDEFDGASAFDPWESSRFFAKVLRGDYADIGVTADRWSCY